MVVTGLELEANQLSGAHSAELVGQLQGLSSVTTLRLADNHLDATLPPRLREWIAAVCRTGTCSGLPPVSCSAFGPAARFSVEDPRVCDGCKGSHLEAIVLLAVAVAVMLLTLGGYVFVLVRHPKVQRRWIAFLTILLLLAVITRAAQAHHELIA